MHNGRMERGVAVRERGGGDAGSAMHVLHAPHACGMVWWEFEVGHWSVHCLVLRLGVTPAGRAAIPPRTRTYLSRRTTRGGRPAAQQRKRLRCPGTCLPPSPAPRRGGPTPRCRSCWLPALSPPLKPYVWV